MGIEFHFKRVMKVNGSDGCLIKWIYLIPLNFMFEMVKI